MTDAIYTNAFTLQTTDHDARLICQDVRGGINNPAANLLEGPAIGQIVAQIVMTMANARALRDLLVEYVKDDPKPEEMH